MRLKRMLPPPKRASYRRDSDGLREWTLLLQPLTKPNNIAVWFLVREYESSGAANSAAYEIRTGRKPGLPEGEWDATARDGQLFVRFMGAK